MKKCPQWQQKPTIPKFWSIFKEYLVGHVKLQPLPGKNKRHRHQENLSDLADIKSNFSIYHSLNITGKGHLR